MQNFPITPQLLQDQLSSIQPTWLSGYARTKSQTTNNEVVVTSVSNKIPTKSITVLSASQTGNARSVAERLLTALIETKLSARLIATGDYKIKDIGNENILLLISSTQGEGEPPEEAIPLFKFLCSKQAPDLSQVKYAVLALGDSSYPEFCRAGRLFDTKLADLGATRILDRVDCDIDFETPSVHWIKNIVQTLVTLIPQNNTIVGTASVVTSTRDPIIHNGTIYTKEEPYTATLALRQKITSYNANKDVQHIEIDISDSNMVYQAGDSLGVWFKNDPQLVDEILEICHLSGEEMVKLEDRITTVKIRHALLELDEITQNSPQFIKGLAALSLDEELLHIANDPVIIQDLVGTTSIVNMLKKYPANIYAQTLHNFLRPLTPRFYSIASSQLEVKDKVHLTVGVVRFEREGRIYTGGASGFLGERLREGDKLKIFVETNHKFRLPNNSSVPIIMIASGTGIAPFRAFMQERKNTNATGQNWLIFGNQKVTDDFLYQVEWQNWYKQGLLNKISLAWSRQRLNKVYVQHKLEQEAETLWRWLQKGAHIYVCGAANTMAKDVEQKLLQIIQDKGYLTEDDAEEYLNELRMTDRYQRDVY
ncbi:MAG: assimilatory sulfite reductase (NADPH) flavoprotein subunit [Neisseriaceae bacterium]|nr:MAG: assimilatory sulfite reductase (NADPH) flavoprotein subunit [Neisseriaceae bacterium]